MRSELGTFLDNVYNQKRRHSAIGYLLSTHEFAWDIRTRVPQSSAKLRFVIGDVVGLGAALRTSGGPLRYGAAAGCHLKS